MNLLILFSMKVHPGPSALVFRVVPLSLCDISFSFIDDTSLLHIISDFTQNPSALHNENIRKLVWRLILEQFQWWSWFNSPIIGENCGRLPDDQFFMSLTILLIAIFPAGCMITWHYSKYSSPVSKDPDVLCHKARWDSSAACAQLTLMLSARKI